MEYGIPEALGSLVAFLFFVGIIYGLLRIFSCEEIPTRKLRKDKR